MMVVASVVLVAVLLVAVIVLVGCRSASGTGAGPVDRNGARAESFLKSEKDGIADLEGAVEVFQRMCEMPAASEMDMKLYEYGVYSFTGEPLFSVDLVRQFQFPSTGDEYCQVRLTLYYEPTEELEALGSGNFWDEDVEGSFFDAVRDDAVYQQLAHRTPDEIAVDRSLT